MNATAETTNRREPPPLRGLNDTTERVPIDLSAQPDPAAQLRAYALAEADAEGKRADMLRVEFKRIEQEVQPHIERMERGRKIWCEAHAKAMQLREMFGGAQ